MTRLAPSGFLHLDTVRLDYCFIGPQPDAAPTLVMLHEGLGSAAQWGRLPEALARETGCGVLAYSRQGYGTSSPVRLPRCLDFLEREARAVLPRVLDAIGFRRGLLIGHSDGASIAAIALADGDPCLCGGVLIAPHFFVEEATLAGARRARIAYEEGDLRERLARRHADVEGAFRGWNDAWLDPARRDWTIEGVLARCAVPLMILQAHGRRVRNRGPDRSSPAALPSRPADRALVAGGRASSRIARPSRKHARRSPHSSRSSCDDGRSHHQRI